MKRIVTWCCSVGIAFTLGFWLNASLTNTPNSVVSQLDDNSKVQNKTAHKASVDTDVTNPAHISVKTNEPVKVDIDLWLRDKKRLSLKETGAFITLISEMDEASVIKALSDWDVSAISIETAVLLSSMVTRLVELNPNRAIDFASNLEGNPEFKMQLKVSVIVNWANQAPAEALDWFMNQNADAQSPSLQNSVYAMIIFQEMAKKDVFNAINSISLLKTDNQKRLAFNGVFSALETSSEFIDILPVVEDQNDKQIERSHLQQWARNDVEGVKTWVASLEDNAETREIKKEIFNNYFHVAPVEAASWYVAQSVEENYKTDVEHAADLIAGIEPQEALEWVQQRTGIDTQRAIMNVLYRGARNHPEFVEDKLSLVHDQKSQIEIALFVYRSYEDKSRQRAERFLDGLTYKNEIKKKLGPQYRGFNSTN
ncbi:hypothetical protein [Alteromonas sp. KUL150]|uniref:hypothetical protein n=1 Tax=unclassified Alteromonas TaxID=2614992 RepID=UPI00133033BB|nr:hypothetical protein [Alteromonas sp. KUL150]